MTADLADSPHRQAAPVRSTGTRPRVLFLHGFLSSRRVWGPVRREIAADVTVIAPDLLGYGIAERPAAPHGLSDLVAGLRPLVEAERPTHVVGHSMGGIVALALAAEFPGQFERVGVVGLPIYTDRPDGRLFLDQRGWVYRAILSRDALSHAACAGLYRTHRAWLPLAPMFFPRQPTDVVLATFDHCAASHSSGLDRVVFAGLVENLAARVTAPVTALHGARDRSAPVERMRQLVTRTGWDLRESPNAGHQVVVERPLVVARWLRESVLAPPPPVAPNTPPLYGIAQARGRH